MIVQVMLDSESLVTTFKTTLVLECLVMVSEMTAPLYSRVQDLSADLANVMNSVVDIFDVFVVKVARFEGQRTMFTLNRRGF
jgi:hypothetical protein